MKACILAAVATLASAADLLSTIQGDSRLATLSTAIKAAGLESTLQGSGPFTIFAPTDAAFSREPWEGYKVKYLLDPANKDKLTNLLEYHIVNGAVKSSELSYNEQLTTLEGQDLTVSKNATATVIDDVTCDSAGFVEADIAASNGVIHVIDAAFVPNGVFCPDTVFSAEQRGAGRISAYGFACRRKGYKHLDSEPAGTKPVGIAVDDSNGGSIFWSNDQDYPHGSPTSWASGLSYDGSNHHRVLSNLIDPQGMTTETNLKKLYVAEHSGFRISRSNYDGSDYEILISKPSNNTFQPSDVAIDSKNGFMFASVEGPEQQGVGYIAQWKMNSTGYPDANSEKILIPYGTVHPYGLCVDVIHQDIFYIVGGHGGQLRCVSYDATPCSSKGPVVQDILDYPYMCAVDSTFVPYGGPTNVVFTQANLPGQIFYTAASGGSKKSLNRTDVISTGDLQAPEGVALGCLGTGTW
jgi:uncharacterized surface protein with fasciclin (FAS1) repeats